MVDVFLIVHNLQDKDLVQIIQKQIDLLNWYWNFFIVTVAVILGWIVSRKKADGAINTQILTALKYCFIVFAAASFVTITTTSCTLALLVEELKTKVTQPGSGLFENATTKSFIAWFNIRLFVGLGSIAHLIGDVLIIVILSKASKDTDERTP